MHDLGPYSFRVKPIHSSEYKTFKTALKQDVRFMRSVENSASATSFLLATYSLFFVEFGSQDEVPICVVNEYLLSGLLSHTARHTHLNSVYKYPRNALQKKTFIQFQIIHFNKC